MVFSPESGGVHGLTMSMSQLATLRPKRNRRATCHHRPHLLAAPLAISTHAAQNLSHETLDLSPSGLRLRALSVLSFALGSPNWSAIHQGGCPRRPHDCQRNDQHACVRTCERACLLTYDHFHGMLASGCNRLLIVEATQIFGLIILYFPVTTGACCCGQ